MAGSITGSATEYLDGSGARLARVDRAATDAHADLRFKAWQDDRAVYVFGNGGRAGCASHQATQRVQSHVLEVAGNS